MGQVKTFFYTHSAIAERVCVKGKTVGQYSLVTAIKVFGTRKDVFYTHSAIAERV